jgi:hypothetical protein
VQDRKLARISFLPLWNDVVLDALLVVHKGKLARASFPPW